MHLALHRFVPVPPSREVPQRSADLFELRNKFCVCILVHKLGSVGAIGQASSIRSAGPKLSRRGEVMAIPLTVEPQ